MNGTPVSGPVLDLVVHKPSRKIAWKGTWARSVLVALHKWLGLDEKPKTKQSSILFPKRMAGIWPFT